MYTIELLFTINNLKVFEESADTINALLSALRMNGQILGREFSLIHKGNRIISYVFVPEVDSLNKKYSNKYVLKYYDELKKLDAKLSQKIIGKELNSSEVCKCKCVNSYILYTDYLTLESPLHCGDCFGVIPLYKIPKTYDDEYYDIKRWETNYQCCDALQMNCHVGEKFGMKQLSDFKSNLNQDGIDICKKIKCSTGKNIFYYLYHYVSSPKKHTEEKRRCPSCGNEWLLNKKLFNRFDFKCNKCLLLSNIST